MKKAHVKIIFDKIAKGNLVDENKDFRMAITKNIVNMLPIVKNIEEGMEEAKKRFFPDDLQKRGEAYNKKLKEIDTITDPAEKARVETELAKELMELDTEFKRANAEFAEFQEGSLNEEIKVSIVRIPEDSLYSFFKKNKIEVTGMESVAISDLCQEVKK